MNIYGYFNVIQLNLATVSYIEYNQHNTTTQTNKYYGTRMLIVCTYKVCGQQNYKKVYAIIKTH